ncbi:MAG: hypothetical protein JWM91_1753, partial [Rhodospirillales bacterium]|nr:hypothetical protein [Rhodospirillales bacterium]
PGFMLEHLPNRRYGCERDVSADGRHERTVKSGTSPGFIRRPTWIESDRANAKSGDNPAPFDQKPQRSQIIPPIGANRKYVATKFCAACALVSI